MKYELSKSKYCKGIQCPKILWLDENKPEVAEEISSESVLETGTKVGELARSYFGEYDLVAFNRDKQKMVEQTAHFMMTSNNIAEASFYFDGLFCAVDILHRNGNGWDIVEVKSSTEVSDIYIEDMAFQYYVLLNCSVPVQHIYNLHIDNTYVRNGPLEIKKLLMLEDCTDAVIRRFCEIKDQEKINKIREYMKAKVEPPKDIDCCCDKPYECVYKKYCGRHLPEYSVFNLARMQTKKKYELYHQGIISYEDIIKNADKINVNQKRQVESVLYHMPDTYDKEEIRNFLNTLSYPLYHLDFETFQQAIPEFDGCRPYEQIPFQYSLHIEYADGHLEHREFLAKEGKDPRRELAESLIKDIPENVCAAAYNMSFEKTVIRHLAASFLDLSDHLMNIYNNMHDLMIPFQKQYYYSAAMQGSYSIKYVLPALWPGDPELDYHNLNGVHNGSEASASFADMANHTPEEIAVMRKNLLQYCGLDTYAMVKVLRKLREVVEEA